MSTDTTCLSGSPPFTLELIYDDDGQVTCLPGFNCPELDPANSSTFPIACTPTASCQLDRLFGSECDDRQSIFEPVPCEAGFYCPTPQESLECPKNHFCVGGTVVPSKCPAMALCPAGSDRPRDMGPLLFVVILVVALLLIRWRYMRVWRLRGHVPGGKKKDASEKSSEQEMQSSKAGEAPAKTTFEQTLTQNFRSVSGDNQPIKIDFTDLRVSIPATGQTPEKVLLQGVCGTLKPGTVTAIMGPSGAGKTVLLTTLLQRLRQDWKVEGSLLVNGQPGNFQQLRSFIGFVPQDDILHNELTVEANLYYASELRLPATWSADRRQHMRDVVMEALGLLPHRTSVIGTESERGISGGQRKRASIGLELASAPLLLFLDEPTSGLDSTTSLELVQTLKMIATAANITVAMVVHQPRVEIWNALDELLILGVGGRTVYKGPVRQAQGYFEGLGVTFDPKHNPADVIMDTVAARTEQMVRQWAQQDDTPQSTRTPLSSNAAGAAFHGANPLRQFVLFFMRNVEKQLSNGLSLAVELSVGTILGLTLGNSMADFSLGGTYVEPYDRFSPTIFTKLLPQLHMYQLMSLGLAASVAGVGVFGNERIQYFREVPTGVYRLSYFVANVLAAQPRVWMTALLYSTTFSVLAALVVPFQYMYFVAMLSYWATYGMGACVSVVANRSSASLIAATVSIAFAVFNGFIDFPVWMKRMTFGFYASQILQQQHADFIEHFTSDAMASDATGYERGQLTLSFFVVILWGIVLHAVAFALMVLTNRDKQR